MIHLIGLGTGSIEELTLGAWEALARAPRVLLHTQEHPVVAELRERGVRFEMLPSRAGEDSSADVAASVLAAAETGDVAYAVPGHPLIGDRGVHLIREEAARRGVETRVYPGSDASAVAFQEFAAVIARLRGPDGCPWDREQTFVSLKRFMIEEAYEAVEAVDSGQKETLCDELGDVLIQVGLNAQLAAEEGSFTITDVIDGVTAKLIRRHPHVFGDVTVADSAEVLRNWDQIKRAEKPERTSILDGVPRDLPALMKAMEVSKRAVKVGFEWPSLGEVFTKLSEEIAELRAAVPSADPESIAGELGDVLFTTVNIARFLKIDPEDALRTMVARFGDRFRHMEREAARRGRGLTDLSLEEWDRLWETAKAGSG